MDEIKSKKIVVIIAGNIGAGKSTLLEYLKTHQSFSNFAFIKEFIDKSWRNLFYSDRKRYTGPFELSCLMGRKARYTTVKNKDKSVFFDRGLIESREVFVQNSFDEGFLSFEEMEDYDRRFKKTLDELGRTKEDTGEWMEALIVYLKTEPKVCFERQKKRIEDKKDFGELIPLGYFERINGYYDSFILDMDKVYRRWGLNVSPKVMIINANSDKDIDKEYMELTAQRILQKIEEIRKSK